MMRGWVGVMTSWPGIPLRRVALGVTHKNHATSRVQVPDQPRTLRSRMAGFNRCQPAAGSTPATRVSGRTAERR